MSSSLVETRDRGVPRRRRIGDSQLDLRSGHHPLANRRSGRLPVADSRKWRTLQPPTSADLPATPTAEFGGEGYLLRHVGTLRKARGERNPWPFGLSVCTTSTSSPQEVKTEDVRPLLSGLGQGQCTYCTSTCGQDSLKRASATAPNADCMSADLRYIRAGKCGDCVHRAPQSPNASPTTKPLCDCGNR